MGAKIKKQVFKDCQNVLKVIYETGVQGGYESFMSIASHRPLAEKMDSDAFWYYEDFLCELSMYEGIETYFFDVVLTDEGYEAVNVSKKKRDLLFKKQMLTKALLENEVEVSLIEAKDCLGQINESLTLAKKAMEA